MIPTAWATEKQIKEARSQTPDSSRGLPPAKERQPDEGFEKALEAIRGQIGKAEGKSAKGQDDTAEREGIKTQRVELDSFDVDIRKDFAATEKKLADSKIPQVILDRHYAFVKHYDDNLKELRANLDRIEKAGTWVERNSYLQKAKAHIEKVKAPTKHKPLDPNNLPSRMSKAKKRQPRLKKEDFEKEFVPEKSQRISKMAYTRWTNEPAHLQHNPIILADNSPASDIPLSLGNAYTIVAASFATTTQTTADLPTDADLAETTEVKFTPELLKISSLLQNNPVQLYEFVRNNFTYDPYYGSIKGSQSTLLLQSGNDFDQASILIALFRQSGYPARYVYGTVDIPIEKVMTWVGGVTKPELAAQILVTNGIPAKLIYLGGVIKSIQMEHVWIEAYLPYGNYRGKINDPTASKAWIPLDPCFKLVAPNPNSIDMAELQNFDIDNYLTNYLQTVKATTPAKDYLSTTINYVAANMPGQRFYDLLASGPIVDKVLDLLPDTLAYPVNVRGAHFSAIPANYRYNMSFDFANAASGDALLSYSAPWSTLLHNRFTLSYVPATTADEQIVAAYGEIYSTPPYLFNVKPVLKVEGNVVAEGSAIGMAGDIICNMSFVSPQGYVDSVVTNYLIAGATYAIGLGSGLTTGRIITYRGAKLEAAATAGESGDSILGEYLNLLAMNYLQELDSSRKLISKSMRLLDTYRMAELMMGVDLGVRYYFGIPRSLNINGITIDVDYNISTPVDMDGNQDKVRRFQILTGMTSSALEHTLFEAIVGVEAISTIKALEIANSQGIPVDQINATNMSAKLPLLQLSSEIKTDIQAAINAGKIVIVSERNIQLNNWNGAGYIVLNPETGAGAYMISGGIAGGSLTQKIGGYQKWVSIARMTEDEVASVIRESRRNIWFRSPVDDMEKVNNGWTLLRCITLNGQYQCAPHNGVDISVNVGSNVYAIAQGDATSAGNQDGGYGNYILIDHGLGVFTLYAHLSSILSSGSVNEGDRIALSGNSGARSAGPHLHFSVFIKDSAHPLYKDGVFNFDASVNPQDFTWTLNNNSLIP